MIKLSRAIYLKCLDCGGDSPKEVTLCPVVDCSLWAFRFGYSIQSKKYTGRMAKAQEKFGDEFTEYEKVVNERLPSVDSWLKKAVGGGTGK